VAVAGRVGHHQGSDVFGGLVGVVGGIGHLHLGHTGQLGGFGSGVGTAGTGHQHMDFTTDLGGCGDGVLGRRLQGLVVVFGNDEDSH